VGQQTDTNDSARCVMSRSRTVYPDGITGVEHFGVARTNESPYLRGPRCGPAGPCAGPGRDRPASKDNPARRVRVAVAAAGPGCRLVRWALVMRSCSAALRAAAAWAARSWFSRSRVTASDSAAS